MTKKTKKKPTWVWIYGDEFDELWEHFGMTVRNDGDRIKLEFVEYQAEEDING